eukprot:TRINITY_DN9260_c0_g1_i1.p1 TRINITY_DN9260_c0_g1~~TRINITY_DN9260_c0_g1_i1.p1  ORF type:complete len:378 (-),score=27.18 TRINITY_DN9260_c0_g1_i1:102-1235(-)
MELMTWFMIGFFVAGCLLFYPVYVVRERMMDKQLEILIRLDPTRLVGVSSRLQRVLERTMLVLNFEDTSAQQSRNMSRSFGTSRLPDVDAKTGFSRRRVLVKQKSYIPRIRVILAGAAIIISAWYIVRSILLKRYLISVDDSFHSVGTVTSAREYINTLSLLLPWSRLTQRTSLPLFPNETEIIFAKVLEIRNMTQKTTEDLLDYLYDADASADPDSFLRNATTGDICWMVGNAGGCNTVLQGVTSKGVIQTILRIRAITDELVEQYRTAGEPKNFDRPEVAGAYIVLEAVNAFLRRLRAQISSDEDDFLFWVINSIYAATGVFFFLLFCALIFLWIPFNSRLSKQEKVPFQVLRLIGPAAWSSNSYVKTFLRTNLK